MGRCPDEGSRAVEPAGPPSEHFMIPLSILELVRVTQETDARGALNNARDLAAHAEKWGYQRVWVAEHHNMAGIASAATVGRACSYRRRDEDHPGRGGRHHASEPCALRHRRAVRNAGAALSRPHRSRTWPRAGHRPAHAARACVDRRRPPRPFRKTSWSSRRSWRRPFRISASRRCRRREPKCRSISWDRAISARCWPPNWACLMLSRRISRPII